MRAQEGFTAANITTSTSQIFFVNGGRYGMQVAGTVTQCNVQRLAADNTTWSNTALTTGSASFVSGELAPGQHRLNVSGSAMYVDVQRIPGE